MVANVFRSSLPSSLVLISRHWLSSSRAELRSFPFCFNVARLFIAVKASRCPEFPCFRYSSIHSVKSRSLAYSKVGHISELKLSLSPTVQPHWSLTHYAVAVAEESRIQ